jgi:hypothetical protein
MASTSSARTTADLPRRQALPAILEHRAARHDAQAREPRERVDEILGDAVAQEVRFRVAALVHERQHRERVDGLWLGGCMARRGHPGARAVDARLDAADELEGGARSARGVLRLTFSDERDEVHRQPHLVPRKLGWIVVQDGDDRGDRGLAPVRVLPRQHLLEDDTEGEDVAALVDGLAPCLLRCHERRRAEHHARPRLHCRGGGRIARRVGVERLGEPEVEDLELAAACHEEIRRLEVAMDDVLLVGGGESVRGLQRPFERERRREGAVPLDLLAERLAFEELHHGEDDVPFHAEVVDGEDVRMRERGDGPRFALETRTSVRVLGEARGKHLERDVSPETRVLGAVDLAHAALAQPLDDTVPGDLCADHTEILPQPHAPRAPGRERAGSTRLRGERPCDVGGIVIRELREMAQAVQDVRRFEVRARAACVDVPGRLEPSLLVVDERDAPQVLLDELAAGPAPGAPGGGALDRVEAGKAPVHETRSGGRLEGRPRLDRERGLGERLEKGLGALHRAAHRMEPERHLSVAERVRHALAETHGVARDRTAASPTLRPPGWRDLEGRRHRRLPSAIRAAA